MTEVDKTRKNSLVAPATDGMVIAQVDVNFSGGLSPNNAKHAGRAALIVVSSRDIHSSAVHAALEIGGHSTKRAKGGFLKLVPANGALENSLQELPDGTSIHIAEEDAKYTPLERASKSALVQPDATTTLSKREISRRFIMNVFSTSEEPARYGIGDLLEKDQDNTSQFPNLQKPEEGKRAA